MNTKEEADLWISRIEDLMLKALKVKKRVDAALLDFTNTDEIWSILDAGLEVFDIIAELGNFKSDDYIRFSDNVLNRQLIPQVALRVMETKINGILESYGTMIHNEGLEKYLTKPTIN